MGVRNAAYNLQCWADNIVVTMGGGIADEDKHDKHDGNDDHNDLIESQMIEIQFVSWLRISLLSLSLTIPLWINMTTLTRTILTT